MTEIGAFERTSAAVWERPERAILAYRAVVVALVAGVGETLGHAALALDDSDVRIPSLALALAIRGAIYVTVFALAARMLTGSQLARAVLVVGLGTVGLASLVMEPIAAALSSPHLAHLFTGWNPNTVILGLFRAAHIIAVLVFVPAAITAGHRTDHR
ncbi:hypothetical protein [Nocardia sp. CDC160]|uniref:hypothetical protein n=1 Tax=Nocardia sp. CDC160 TaxID=3112166 RepID=UPI002DB74A3B|nr:hypothetical protein [Nocardia sp. CDC160]MEC3916786.1 hypothetical protein [Nocardia sp. CDC160]